MVRAFRKPLYEYTREEIDLFVERNRDVQWALRDIAPYMRARDQRGFRRWVFAMGWLCCLTYYEGELKKLATQIAESAEKGVARWESRTKLGLLDDEGEGE